MGIIAALSCRSLDSKIFGQKSKMMHSFLIVLLAVAGLHQVHGGVANRERLTGLFNDMDENNNGEITTAEYDAFRLLFEPFDANDDGSLNVEELTRAIQETASHHSLSPARAAEYVTIVDSMDGSTPDQKFSLTFGTVLLNAYDKDNSGGVNFDEFAGAFNA